MTRRQPRPCPADCPCTCHVGANDWEHHGSPCPGKIRGGSIVKSADGMIGKVVDCPMLDATCDVQVTWFNDRARARVWEPRSSLEVVKA